MKYLVADFETTSYAQYLIDGHTRVFMYAIADVSTEKILNKGTDITQFFEWVFTTRRDRHITCYFHNLRFDGSFILNALERMGYHQETEERKGEKTYKSLITDTGLWYGIKVCLNKAKYKINITFSDSFKKIPMSVKAIAKTYKLPFTKGDFDYDMYRPIGYIPTDAEWDYVFRDVKIVAMGIKIQLTENLTKMTLSSDAYNYFKSLFSKKQFEYLFPQLPKETWKDLRKAYKGGWVYANPNFINKTLKNVVSFDVNSLYPYAMYTDFKLPYGKPIIYTGKYVKDEEYDLYIQTIEVSFDLKDGYLPTLQTASLGHAMKGQFITTTENEIIELTLTNIDLELLLRHHNINFINYKYGYKFRSSNILFKKYIDKWYGVKMEADGGLRELAKKLLNGLYGKWGSNYKKRDKLVELEDGMLTFKNGKEYEARNIYYIPVAIFTTANARSVTINASQKLYKYHVYSDTDSIKLCGITLEEVKKYITVDNKQLGAFKYEARYEQSKFLRAKTYEYILAEEFIKKEEDKGLHIVCSGMTDKIKQELEEDEDGFDNFDFGFKSKEKLQIVQVVGGCVLKPTTYELKMT